MGTIEELKEKLGGLIENRFDRERMGRATRAFALETFSTGHYVGTLRGNVQQYCKLPAVPAPPSTNL